jgi:ABC-2 type transport system ATP-binding protein
MANVLEVTNVTKKYRDTTAVEQLNFVLEENKIYGLLGRNGAGKTTLMHMITAQLFPTSGEIKVFGQTPYENRDILTKVCFIKESQTYPDYFKVDDVFEIAKSIYLNWDENYAQLLIKLFQLPTNRLVKKLSRGQLSMVGIIVGLASRAELTIFDEPYLGLDAVARNIFYDQLLQDYAKHPRTVILSTHLIDEVSKLLEYILLIDGGQLILQGEMESILQHVYTVVGDKKAIQTYTNGKEILHQEELGSVASVTLYDQHSSHNQQAAADLGITIEPVPLQQAIVYLTSKGGN